MFSSLKSSVTGNIEQAIITIKDYRNLDKNSKSSSPMINSETLSALLSGPNSTKVAKNSSKYDKSFKVQFNPHELTLDAYSETKNYSDTQVVDGVQKTISKSSIKPKVDMTVKLIFDRVNTYDAFMLDKLRLSTTINGALGMINSDRGYSVRPVVEGFVSAIRNKYTRNITFWWNKFSFIGQIVNVNAKYTMFSPEGRPIRAEIVLRLRHEMDPELLEHSWYKYFDDVMKDEKLNLTTRFDKFTNILNI